MQRIELFERNGTPANTRNNGMIPVCIYRKGYNKNAAVDNKTLSTLLKNMGYSILSTIFTIVSGKEEFLAIIKDIQIHPIHENIVHIDFLKIQANEEFKIPVQVKIINSEKALFMRENGLAYRPSRTVDIICTTESIRNVIECDVENLKKGDVIQTTDKLWANSGIKFVRNSPLVTIVEKS